MCYYILKQYHIYFLTDISCFSLEKITHRIYRPYNCPSRNPENTSKNCIRIGFDYWCNQLFFDSLLKAYRSVSLVKYINCLFNFKINKLIITITFPRYSVFCTNDIIQSAEHQKKSTGMPFNSKHLNTCTKKWYFLDWKCSTKAQFLVALITSLNLFIDYVCLTIKCSLTFSNYLRTLVYWIFYKNAICVF